MFTQPCFIRNNTKNLRNKLKELGYKCNNGKWMGAYLATFKRDNDHDLFYCGTPEYDLKNNPSLNYSIDCGTNEQLFLAIAALNDNGDYMQWFTNGERWYQNKINDIEIIRLGAGSPIGFHKATVEELIEYFKDK